MISRFVVLTSLLGATILLAGCGGGSGGTTTPPAENRAPVANAGNDQVVGEGTEVTLDASASSDADGDSLTYSWTQTGGDTVDVSDTASASPTFTAPGVDTNMDLVFEVTVNDGELTNTDSVTVTVNAAPTAAAGIDRLAAEGARVALDGSGSTDASDTLTYSWEQLSGPMVTLSDATQVAPEFHAPDVGEIATLEFRLTVSDGVQASTDDMTVEVHPVTMDASIAGIKTLRFGWDGFGDAHHLRLQQNPDGASGFTTVVDDIVPGGSSLDFEIATHLLDWDHAEFLLEACLNAECTSVVASDIERIHDLESLGAIGYFKSSNPVNGDNFGGNVAVSGDGSTLAIAAIAEKGSGDGINPADDGIGTRTGAVYVFRKGETGWEQEAYIKATNSQAFDNFGISIALSHDGNTLAVGAHGEDSNSTGINGDQTNDLAAASGAVYVYRNDGVWKSEAYIKAPNTHELDFFGFRVALSADGNTLAVSAPNENGDTASRPGAFNRNFGEAGAVYVYRHSGAEWDFSDYIKPHDLGTDDKFGESIALSADGKLLVVGSLREDGSGTGVDPAVNEDALDSGAAYVFRHDGAQWNEEAYLKATNTGAGDRFGVSVALSADGSTIAIGADNEDGSGSGVNPPDDNLGNSVGAVYVFRNNGGWAADGYIKLSASSDFDSIRSAALNGDGNLLAIGANGEDDTATGVTGPSGISTSTSSGAVEVFGRGVAGWESVRFVKATNTQASDQFGGSLALDETGELLVIGATGEDGGIAGINGDGSDNTQVSSGAAYIY